MSGAQPRDDLLSCADCGRTIPWRSDEAGEWPVVEEGGSFRTLCFDCYGRRYGGDESSEFARQMRVDQAEERTDETSATHDAD